ncbi:ras-related protein Rab-37 [Contarinia nasturtii]|uniref:ras-related protein Rab-37 n=1 Tax=Contarinia nasturtii TaxID=265458 RepID=UPI0012D46B69|nr:ras-related protein Rab-37 [Contarinia nasturtii]XP_031638390.1 ras-related protein Rab-37 [Contarinia nasturtii]
MNNSAFNANHTNCNQSTQNAQSYRSQPNSPQLQNYRRESLVKPTWQNVCPGEVPFDTLEKLNKLCEGEKQSILMQQQKFRQQTQQQCHYQAKAQNIESSLLTSVSGHTSYRDGGIDSDADTSDDMVNWSGLSNNVSTSGTSNSKQFISKAGRQRHQTDAFDFVGKVMLLGDSGVGKTCLLVRFRDGTFVSGSFISTVGIDFRTKIVQLDNTRVKLQIWDTAGQERFRSVTHAYYRDAHALLLLYDVTNKTSFDNIRAWLVEIHEYAQDDVVILLLGNKSDCPDRQVKREDGERLAREYNVTFMETSAATGLNVDLAFLAVARKLKNRKTDSTDDARFNVQDANEPPTKSLSCPPCNL